MTFMPLVAMVAVIVPGLYAWSGQMLSADIARWGLSGLEVLDRHFWAPAPSDIPVPPWYPWNMALVLLTPANSNSWLVLPSYLYGLASVLLVYAMGKLWYNQGTGLLAAFLFAFNHFFLTEIRQAQPSTCVLAFALLVLYAYLRHCANHDYWLSLWLWISTGAFACLLLSSGAFAYWLPVIGILRYGYRDPQRPENSVGSWLGPWKSAWEAPAARAGTFVVGVATALTIPVWAGTSWFWRGGGPSIYTLSDLAAAMPATAALAGYGLWMAFREALKATAAGERTIFPLLWSLVACLALNTTHPQSSAVLFALVPFTFLAARTLLDVIRRQLSDQTTLALMMATTSTFVFIYSLSGWNVRAWLARHAFTWEQLLRLHLVFDFILLLCAGIIYFYQRTEGKERPRAFLFGCFVVSVLLLDSFPTLFNLYRRAEREDEWRAVEQKLRRHSTPDLLVFLVQGPMDPRLEYTARKVFPAIERVRVKNFGQLQSLLTHKGNNPIVMVVDRNLRVPHSTPIPRGQQTKMLSSFHDTDLVTVYSF